MLMVLFQLLSRLRLLICKNDRGGSDVVLQGPFCCDGLKCDHPLTKPHTRPAPQPWAQHSSSSPPARAAPERRPCWLPPASPQDTEMGNAQKTEQSDQGPGNRPYLQTLAFYYIKIGEGWLPKSIQRQIVDNQYSPHIYYEKGNRKWRQPQPGATWADGVSEAGLPIPEGRNYATVHPSSHHRAWRLRKNKYVAKNLNEGSFKLLKIQTSEVHYGDRTGNFSSLDITKNWRKI